MNDATREIVRRLFAVDWYGRQSREPEPLRHFLETGWRQFRNPSRWFSTRYYLACSPTLSTSPLVDFAIAGAEAGRQPHPWFDTRWYSRRYLGLAGPSPMALVHFLEQGVDQCNVPHPALDDPDTRSRLARAAPDQRHELLDAIIAERTTDLGPARALVDAEWYNATYPDVARAGVPPDRHYLTQGWRERRDPNPWFWTAFYQSIHPAIAAEGICPLVHFAQRGAFAGADPSPYFAAAWYRARHMPGRPATENALFHFRTVGLAAGAVPHPSLDQRAVTGRVATIPLERRTAFLQQALVAAPATDDLLTVLVDQAWYARRYPDTRHQDSALHHYLQHGWREGRDPSPWFSSRDYLRQNPDASTIGPLIHFMQQRAGTDARPCEGFDTAWYRRRYLDEKTTAAEALGHFLRIGLASGCVPHPSLDQPAIRDRLMLECADDRSELIRCLLELRRRTRSTHGEASYPWFLAPPPPATMTVLTIIDERDEDGGAMEPMLAGDEIAVRAVGGSRGRLTLSPGSGKGPGVGFLLPRDTAILRPILRFMRCSRAILSGDGPDRQQIARCLRAAGVPAAIVRAGA